MSKLTTLADEITEQHAELGLLVTRSVELVWKIGQKLSTVKGILDHGQFVPWIEQNLTFARRTANNYLSVFEKFPAGLPPGMDLRTAYIEAGVKKLVAPAGEGEEGRGAGDLIVPARDWEKEWRRLAKSPTLSGVQLKNYRVVVNSDERVVYALRRGHHEPIPIAGVLFPPQAGAEAAWDEYHKMLQLTTEGFLEKLEALEADGVIQAPVDHSPMAKLARGKARVKGAAHVPD